MNFSTFFDSSIFYNLTLIILPTEQYNLLQFFFFLNLLKDPDVASIFFIYDYPLRYICCYIYHIFFIFSFIIIISFNLFIMEFLAMQDHALLTLQAQNFLLLLLSIFISSNLFLVNISLAFSKQKVEQFDSNLNMFDLLFD